MREVSVTVVLLFAMAMACAISVPQMGFSEGEEEYGEDTAIAGEE